MIDINKKYTTRRGDDVELISKVSLGADQFRFIGMVRNNAMTWDQNGISDDREEMDLVLKKAPAPIDQPVAFPISVLNPELAAFIQNIKRDAVDVSASEVPEYMKAFAASKLNQKNDSEWRTRAGDSVRKLILEREQEREEKNSTKTPPAPAPDFELLKRFATTAMAFVVSEAQIAASKTSTAAEGVAESGLASMGKLASNIDMNKVAVAVPMVVSAIGGLAAIFSQKNNNGK